MPDLSTLSATRPARTNTASSAPTAVPSQDASSSGFLGQLQQSLTAGPADAGSIAAQTAASPKTPQLDGPSPPTDPLAGIAPPKLAGKTTSTPASILEKKANVQDGPAAPDRTHHDDTTPASDPQIPSTLPATTSATATPTSIGVGGDAQTPAAPPTTGHHQNATETASLSGHTTANATVAQPALEPGLSAAGSQDAAVPSTPGKPSIDPSLHPAAAASASPPLKQTSSDPAAATRTSPSGAASQSAAPEIRRSKLAVVAPASPDPTVQTEAAVAPPPAAPTSSIAPTPHLGQSTVLATATPATQAPSAAPPPSPAVQVAQAVAEPVRVILASPPLQSNLPHVTTIQLDPAELGRVEIRIERTNDGPAKIQLAAERPDTLLRLVHDQPQLQQALDQAGIPQHGRTITFSLAADTAGSSSSFSNPAGNGAFGGNGQRSQQSYGNPNASAVDTIDSLASTPVWSRTGLDITA